MAPSNLQSDRHLIRQLRAEENRSHLIACSGDGIFFQAVYVLLTDAGDRADWNLVVIRDRDLPRDRAKNCQTEDLPSCAVAGLQI